ncbi:MAG: FKBP-type peptidyl-prolyl cis-trans isomerase [Marinilabiliales bacterium]|nr:MAG: FKBP-type peptidyl-prolyl cis-trans isomerase [Marinilabiliales bacterium]
MKFKILTTLLLSLTIVFNSCGQGRTERSDLKTEADTISYAIGITFGHSLMTSGLEDINPEAIALAISEMINNESTMFNPEEANMYLNEYFAKMQFGENLEEGENFLAENMLREGVTVTESGIQYEVIEMGEGPRPSAEDEVVVHYRGTLIDGTEFDSSYSRNEPAQFQLNRVIPGWTEALQLMPVGSKWRIFIPQDLAYGANPRQGGMIEPYMMLIFEVELLDIVSD